MELASDVSPLALLIESCRDSKDFVSWCGGNESVEYRLMVVDLRKVGLHKLHTGGLFRG